MTVSISADRVDVEGEQHRLHKPGVVGSSPTAATFVNDSVSIDHCPSEEYHGRPEVSCSQLKELASSPLAFYLRHIRRVAPPKSGDSLSYGTLLHLWAEVGEQDFWQRAAIAPASVATSAGQLGKASEEWAKTLAADAIPVSPADAEKLRLQTEQILLNDAARECIEQSIDREFNVRWVWNGHAMRCRCDGATSSYWYDFKTTRDYKPLDSFWRSVSDYGYELQAAVYESAAVAAGWPRHGLRFIVTSTVWPHHCEVVTLPEAVVQRGRKKALALLAELQQRREWDSWLPSTYGRVHELECPKFMHERRG
jgi:hypothetical protein